MQNDHGANLMEGVSLLIDGEVVAKVVRTADNQYTISALDGRIRGIVDKMVSPGSKFRGSKFEENLLFLPACLQDVLPGLKAKRIRTGI